MAGIQIINTYTYYNNGLIAVSIGLVVICIICTIQCFFENDLAIFVFILLGVFVGYFGIYYESQGTTRYEARIDKTLSYLEFTDKYHVIEQRGDIWVLGERSGNNR